MPVLDEPSFLHKESEVASPYLNLPVGEVLGIDTAFYAAYDILFCCIASTHICTAHAWQGHVAETLAATVACALYTKVTGTDTVVQVAVEDSLVN